ncbi:hypothetical protein VNO80_04211 [Phaseolus coccineus]|uniref:Reverse transcriptase zinc-binding domain-containing protein n=1 Tax=Phaseolus coccineus TaxID=3886 RepID=A0AAN9NT07_PHACN
MEGYIDEIGEGSKTEGIWRTILNMTLPYEVKVFVWILGSKIIPTCMDLRDKGWTGSCPDFASNGQKETVWEGKENRTKQVKHVGTRFIDEWSRAKALA